jgi:hypothetical protein
VQRAQFAHVADACRAARVRLDVVVFPFFSDWGGRYRYDRCHDLVVDEWKKLGVAAVDLRDAYRGIPGPDLVVNRLDGHPNPAAHEIAARVVLERVFDVK